MPKIGDRFTVPRSFEAKDARGRILARYLPEFDYRVTPRNLELVTRMEADGVATVGGRSDVDAANRLATRPAKVTGKARIGKESA